MFAEIDVVRFEQSSGELRWLPVVAAAFLKQLPSWRIDFSAALEAEDQNLQLVLLHKMKGACQAVAARKTAEVIEDTESAYTLRAAPNLTSLLSHLDRVEAELRIIADNALKVSRIDAG